VGLKQREFIKRLQMTTVELWIQGKKEARSAIALRDRELKNRALRSGRNFGGLREVVELNQKTKGSV